MGQTINTQFERKIKNMTEEQLEAHIDKLFSKLATSNIAEATAIGHQMATINELLDF